MQDASSKLEIEQSDCERLKAEKSLQNRRLEIKFFLSSTFNKKTFFNENVCSYTPTASSCFRNVNIKMNKTTKINVRQTISFSSTCCDRSAQTTSAVTLYHIYGPACVFVIVFIGRHLMLRSRVAFSRLPTSSEKQDGDLIKKLCSRGARERRTDGDHLGE